MKISIKTICISLLILLPISFRASWSWAAPADPPNFLVIVADDQRDGTLGKYMPNVQKKIFDEGVTFSQGYITTPACCPSRTTMLTGNYTSKHGVLVNRAELKKETLMHTLQGAGFYTGLIGKFLNSWNGTKREEADFWVSFKGGSSRYFNPRLNVNGFWRDHFGYMTYILRDYVFDFIDAAQTSQKPFFLFFTPNAPHNPYTPAFEDVGRWSNEPLPYAPSRYRRPFKGKPKWVLGKKHLRSSGFRKKAAYQILNKNKIEKIERNARAQLEMLWSLDQAVGSIVDELAARDILKNTVIIYVSDNGLMWGEHSLTSKDCAYQEAIKVPFGMRYPPLVPAPRIEGSLVANIDIAPTIMQLAGLGIPSNMDGFSIKEILSGEKKRDHLIIEGFRKVGPRKPFTAIHTDRYVYVLNKRDLPELYDLSTDPYQLVNLANRPSLYDLKHHLRSQLIQDLKDLRKPGSIARKVFSPR